ncbi:MAG: Crp/Fnr family transcriptional regulator [Fluviicola sp.]|nr:Crp/Fnr family transcriptional regulator [Fluviicola sp.]
MIGKDILLKYGAIETRLSKSEIIFKEGDHAKYYYQIISGEVKMFNINRDGKEFIQGIFSKNRSFGEPPLFNSGNLYVANAIALQDTNVLKLSKDSFIQLLKENPDIHIEFTQTLADRLHFKSLMAAEISNNDPEARILTLLDYLKFTIYKIEEPFEYEVELTRQQIADLTGLRVETVIRSIKSLEKKGKLKIVSRKVWR